MLPAANGIGFGTGIAPNYPLFVDAVGITRCTFSAVGVSAGNNFTVDDFTFRAGCHVTVTAYGQAAPPWGPTQYDNTTNTMRQKGCAVTALAMSLTARSFGWDPGSLNTQMKTPPMTYFTSGGSVIWGSAAALGGGVYLPIGSTAAVDAALCNGQAVIVGVSLDAAGVPGHFVTIIGKTGADYLMQDPVDGQQKSLIATYGSNYALRGAIGGGITATQSIASTWGLELFGASSAQYAAGPSRSVSVAGVLTLSFAIDNATLAVTNALGQSSGIDLTNGAVQSGIPGAVAWADRIDDILAGIRGTTTTAFVQLSAVDGPYRGTVTPTQSGVLDLIVSTIPGPGTPPPPVHISVLGQPGLPVHLTLAVDASGTVAVSRAGGFSGARQDVQSALSLGLLKNGGIATSLLQKLDNAQASYNRGNSSAGLNQLEALTNHIRAQTDKGIDPAVADILLQDVTALQRLVSGA